jgi:hypothetical protein
MTDKKIPVHIVFTSVYFLLAVVTLIPMGTASKVSLLGYKALCSFSPISTIGLLALGGFHIYLHRRAAAKKAK